jgi:hypothetical protein
MSADYVHIRRENAEALVRMIDDRWTPEGVALRRIKDSLRAALARDPIELDAALIDGSVSNDP